MIRFLEIVAPAGVMGLVCVQDIRGKFGLPIHLLVCENLFVCRI